MSPDLARRQCEAKGCQRYASGVPLSGFCEEHGRHLQALEQKADWSMRSWLASRPAAIQELARRFPPTSKFDETRWVFGYQEFKSGRIGLWLTTIPPEGAYDRYEEMLETKEIICPDCLDEGGAS